MRDSEITKFNNKNLELNLAGQEMSELNRSVKTSFSVYKTRSLSKKREEKKRSKMNNLEGYNTTGHEYRMSQIDRSNSRRLKWMMNEARDIVKKQDEIKKDNNKTILGDKNITPMLHGNSNNKTTSNVRKNMFNPSTVNKFVNMKNNNSFK